MKIYSAISKYFQTSDHYAIVNRMSSLFKEKRIALGKELKEFADLTRIRESHLRAIEECRFEKLPVPVYSRGYIRDYARALGVDPAPILAEYEHYLQGPENTNPQLSLELTAAEPVTEKAAQSALPLPATIVAEPPQRPVTLTVERQIQLEEHTSGGRSLKLSLAFFALLVVIGGAALYHMYGSNGQSATQQVVPDVIVKEPVMVRPADTSQKPAEAPAASVPAMAKPESAPAAKTETTAAAKPAEPQLPVASAQGTAPSGKKHVLAISATDKVWVQLILDKTDKKEMLLNPGDALRFEASDSFRLWIGNAGGLKLSLDGREIAHGGKVGQALRLVLPDTTGGQQQQKKKVDQSPSQPAAPRKTTPTEPTAVQ